MRSIVRFGHPLCTSSVRTGISPLSSLGSIRSYHRHAALVDPLVPFRGTPPRRTSSIFPADPFAMLDEMQNVMKSLDRDFFKDVSKYTRPSRGLGGGGDTPLRALSSTLGSVDVQETDNHYIISVDCPGVTQDDVKLSIKEQDGGHVLTISGERSFTSSSSSSDHTDGKKKIPGSTTTTTTPSDTKGSNDATTSDASLYPSTSSSVSTPSSSSPNEVTWHLQERSIGAFERHFWLPQNLNVDSTSADFTNGVLTVSFEKQTQEHQQKEKIIKINNKQ